MSRRLWVGLAALMLLAGPAHADELNEAWIGTYWGEMGDALTAHFGARATPLPQPIDFGDSYVSLVLRQFSVGGFPLIVFYQMDKATHGLKRIQLERPRHGVTPAAFRGVLAALEDGFGAPDRLCGVRPSAASGYQQAAERIWMRNGMVIRTIFRDTTLEALEGCLVGTCGLTAQLLVRVSPPQGDDALCPRPTASPDMHAGPRG